MLSAVRCLHQSSSLLQQVQKGAPAKAGSPPKSPSAPRPAKPAATPQQKKPTASSVTSASVTPAKTDAATSAPTDSATTTTTTTTTTSSEVATEDGKPAQKTLKERAKELWATAKYLFKFYFNGVKQIWANRNRVAEIQQRVAGGGAPLSREEAQLIRVHRADMRKLPLFLTILLILEEALPLVVIWAPSLLPSTCILPNQLLKIRMKEEVARAAAYKKLCEVEEVKALLPVVSGTGQNLRLAQPHKDADDEVLAKIKGETLVQLAKLFSLSTWGGAAMTRRRLVEHLKYIRSDDEMMCEGGGYQFIPQNAEAVAKACSERGLRATEVPQKEMYDTLRTWLLYTTRSPATSRSLSTSSLALLPLQLYNPRSIQEIEASLAAESGRGLMEKTKDVLNEVVETEKKVLERDQKTDDEIQQKAKEAQAARK
ncbi:uncharacterized protein PFL1_04989 [Pseudozyma flocculosa PF-1]|uniref:Letm1 RBD domain-containing protein n=2 Tax=Pseudozyma flocculosa TaxID=84751 RepID=A0A5C3EW74_9BASI|nr:uncharacterized protein PFL1_04989 [Pseudozyma flocculosa PF-1]EPQ27451.1 hypothetical protein PFL1_04989 [Pseudozyma flocculosa PF-1]SPO36120.1 uncharacterized protein PSFLO_01591 [Pseudozyma flocculosa]